MLVGLWFAVRGIQCLSPIPVCAMRDREPAQSQEEITTVPAQGQEETTIAPAKPTRIEWIHSEPEGLALAKETKKPLLIDFRADWCVYCRQMERTTLLDKRVIEAPGRFVSVKVDVTSYTPQGQAAAEKYKIVGIPAFIFIDTQGNQTVEVGYKPPDRFLQLLKSIK